MPTASLTLRIHLVGAASLAMAVAACGSDARSPEHPDATSPDGSIAEPTDSSTEHPDSGAKTSDAGSNPSDAGAQPSDSGAKPPDAGMHPVIDAPPSGAPPALTAGVWRKITPPGVNLADGCCKAYPNDGFNGNTFGVTWVEIDPSRPYTLYAAVDVEGLWKTTDGGSSWKRLGTPPAAPTFGVTVPYLDSPVRVRVDPKDSEHLYATQGVRGGTLGFWVSHDGGNTWSAPRGFVTAEKTATNDVTTMVVDPSDFGHVLLGSHSPWANDTSAGILETKDGGDSFLLHGAQPSWPKSGSLGIAFYFDQALGIGTADTWLVSTDGAGIFRTDDSAKTWKQLSASGAVHGGSAELYFTKNGYAYAGGNNHMLRSVDQGMTWDAIGPSTPDGYYQVIGDGKALYAQSSNTGANTTGPGPYITSSETDGVTWNPYQGGTQKFTDGPYVMRFDSVNRILYSANWGAGLWALKVL